MRPAALFSLDDTTRAAGYARRLAAAGWEILASSETAAVLKAAGVPVRDLAEFTGVREDYGFPPTLHPKVEQALTADAPERIELVYVLPYPASKGNDIGGRTLLALAVKGGRIAVMDDAGMEKAVSALERPGGLTGRLRRELADKVCFEIAAHYASLVRDRDTYDIITGKRYEELLNGENPYQSPAFAFAAPGAPDRLALPAFKRVSGEAPCYTNLADADNLVQALCLAAGAFRLNTGSVPFLCIAAKHGNPCGMGMSAASPAEAAEKALFGDPRAIWGGEVITNFPVDEAVAGALYASGRRESSYGSRYWMLDLVLAPGFSGQALALLGKSGRRKLFENEELLTPSLRSGHQYRMVRGGFLRQPPANYAPDLVSGRADGDGFSGPPLSSLLLAWAAAYSANNGGNEVALAKDGMLLSVGGGPSTREACGAAVERAKGAGHDPRGSVFAADAFFPFTDAPALLCDAGAAMGCVPAGGRREAEVRDLFRARGVSVAYLPPEYRGFCRH